MPSPQLVNDEYKQKFLDLKIKLGHVPTTADKEYWEISEWYKDQYDVDRLQRMKEEAYERQVERKLASQPVKVVEAICRTCPNLIEPTGKRGRPPVFCLECRNAKNVKKVKVNA